MDEAEFKRRTKDVALRIVRVVQSLPKDLFAQTLGKQLLRSGTSIGANYRAACRAKSTADIINKLTIVEEEADEVHVLDRAADRIRYSVAKEVGRTLFRYQRDRRYGRFIDQDASRNETMNRKSEIKNPKSA